MVINKAVFTAIHQNTDYLSNSWTEYRTAIDGHDVEVMSSKALHWLEDNARSDYDLEHVTPAIRNYVNDLIKGVLINKEDMSMIKTCIDTFDDYSAAVRRFASSTEKRYDAVRSGLNVYEY
jgi:spore coat polysaccharide biosynthesis protein SpsF (cytidylyltransferase family)